jgi:hypothetical protein
MLMGEMAGGAPASDGTGVSGSVMGAQQRKNYAKFVLTSVRKGRQDRLALSRVGVSPERAPPDLLPARETANDRVSLAQGKEKIRI